MIDLHRRDALARFMPAVAAIPEAAVQDAYLGRLAVLSDLPVDELRRVLRRSPEREDRAALRVLGMLAPAVGTGRDFLGAGGS